MKMFKVLDAFAGAGGFSLGFLLSGHYEVIGAIEQDKWAAETFQYNHPKTPIISHDITQLSDFDIISSFPEQPQIILGGPPCQGFSIANRNSGDPKDPRNSLFKEFIRLAKLFRPDVLIMENVPNLLKSQTHNKKRVIDLIEHEFKDLGYNTYTKILSAVDYGVPQIRKRLFVIASLEALESPFPTPSHSINSNPINLFGDNVNVTPSLWDAISDLPSINAREGSEVMDYTSPPLNEFQAYLRQNASQVFNHKAMNHSKRMIERFANMSYGSRIEDIPKNLRPQKRNGKGAISDKYYDQNNSPNAPCHTIAASFYANFIHPYRNRNFTPREGARVQSFPDWYRFLGKPTVVSHKLLAREGRTDEKYLCQYNQIGNAVPPLLAKAIATNLYTQLTSEVCSLTATI